MFTVYTGSYRALEQEFIRQLTSVKEKRLFDECLVLCPSQRLLDHLQKQITQQHPVLLNVHFLTFYALAERLLETLPGRCDQVVSEPFLFQEIIRRLLEKKEDSVEFMLRTQLHHPDRPLPKGLCGSLAGTLRDLRDSGARVLDALGAALEGHLQEESAHAAPALELYARVYEVLQNHHLRTRADQLRRAADQTHTHPWLKRQQGVFLYGFYDLTGVQLDFVMSLADLPNAQLYFPYEEEIPAYAFAERLLKDPALQRKVGKTIQVPSNEVRGPSPHLEPRPSALAPAIDVWNCSGLQDEVWLTAKKILMLAGAGVPYRDMAIITRTLAPYSGALRHTLETHRIPYSMYYEEPVGAYPLIKMLRQLLTMAQNDFPRTQVFDVLQSPYLKPLRDEPGWYMPAFWKHLAEQAGIVSGWPSWKERWGYWAKHELPKELLEVFGFSSPTAVRDAALHGLELLETLRRDLLLHQQGDHSWSQHSEWTRHLIQRWVRLPSPAFREEQQLLEAFENILKSLTALDSLESPVPLDHFLETLSDKLDSLTLALAPRHNAGVQVLDIMAARGRHFKAVFVLGLNEKTFPRLIREDPFLSDSARSALSNALGCRLSRKMDGYQEERLLFHLATEMADQHLHLSYQRSDEEGKALVPSLYLHEWMLAHNLRENHLPRALVDKWNSVSPSLWTPKELSILMNRESQSPESLYQSLGWDVSVFHLLKAAQVDLERFQGSLGPRDAVVGSFSGADQLFKDGFSPHSLEMLAACPFQYYAQKVLALAPQDIGRASGELASDQRGKLMHRILETLFRSWPRPEVPVSKPEIERRLEDACEQSFKLFSETALNLYPVAWKSARQTIYKQLLAFLAYDLSELHDSSYWPQFLEVEMKGPIPGMEPLIFQGRADRIDTTVLEGSVHYRIIDYKTGKQKSGKMETHLQKGTYLQLPLYLGLAQAFLEKSTGQKAIPEGAYLYNLLGLAEGDTPAGIPAAFWDTQQTSFSDMVQGLTTLIRKGVFYIRPGDETGALYCDWCAFSTICRRTHRPTRHRSAHDPIRQRNDERLRGKKA